MASVIRTAFKACIAIFALCLSGGSMADVHLLNMHPYSLQCECAESPLGVDNPNPKLSWKLSSSQRNVVQSAYQIIAATNQQDLSDTSHLIWDSGKMLSSDSVAVAYSGKPLKSAEQVFWKVRVWDNSGNASWSHTANWTMGLLRPSDWCANWISYQPVDSQPDNILLRTKFPAKPDLRRALAFVCGLGQYEISINGQKVGDGVLAPGWTNYRKTCLYDTRDITKLIVPGNNAIGITLGNGMYNSHGGRYAKFEGSFGPLCAICQIRLEYDDGSVQIIGSDNAWKSASGPITFSSPFGGEDYDARLDPIGWDTSKFNDASWQAAIETDGTGGTLRGHSYAAPELKLFETFAPVQITSINSTTKVYDFGQNAAYIPKLDVHGSAGSSVAITAAELTHPDGTVDRQSVGGGDAYWKYTLDGCGEEAYIPKFFYQGGRYFQVVLTPGPDGKLPVVDSLVGRVVGSSSPSIGQFSCSNDLFNRIHTLIRWAQRSNTVSVLTDCPHREKLGWLEESYLNGPALRYEHELNRLYTKISSDMADSQLDNGLVPDIAPEYAVFPDGFRDSPEWGSAVAMDPWQQYEFTGDPTLLERNYSNIKRYVDYLTSKSVNHIVDYGLGDWYDIGPNPPGYSQLTPISLTATATYYQDCLILAKTAQMNANTTDFAKYSRLAESIKEAFNSKFWNSESNQYSTGSQCANAMSSVTGLVPDSKRALTLDALVADIKRHNYSATAGDIGYRYVLRALADAGRSDIIFEMNNQSDKPGYGMQLAKGATSLTEAWDANPSSSQNHFMLGQINEWFYTDLGGIQSDPSGHGFKKVLIKPSPVGDITWVKCSYDCVHGPIVSNWTCTDGIFKLSVSIPPNTTATIFVPTTDPSSVIEDGTPVTVSHEAVNPVGQCVRLSIGSGDYVFESKYKRVQQTNGTKKSFPHP